MSDPLDDKTPDELIEDGLGLIARGLFRLGHTEKRPAEAASRGWLIVSHIREMAIDFLKQTAKDGARP